MQGIRDRVAIIGMGCTKFGERWEANGRRPNGGGRIRGV